MQHIPQQDLDQLELMKQFIGTWSAKSGVDTIVFWEIIPSNKGYIENYYWQTKGETYQTANGIIGFTWQYKKVLMYSLYPSGYSFLDIGEFMSDKKLIMERFNANHTKIIGIKDINFLNSDKFDLIYKWGRGEPETWDDINVSEYTFSRIKK